MRGRRARAIMPATVRTGIERILDAGAPTRHVVPVTAVGTGLPRIPRPALARRLADGLDAGSVFLVAGAGYGKTMALEEAIALANRRAVWLPCGESGGEAGRLLIGAVKELRGAAPGLADVVGDRLAAGMEPVDVRAATNALLAELERLLVEPLVIVFDDAEELEDADAALALIDQLLSVRAAPVSVAVATRRALRLKLAKLRVSGRLVVAHGPGGRGRRGGQRRVADGRRADEPRGGGRAGDRGDPAR